MGRYQWVRHCLACQLVSSDPQRSHMIPKAPPALTLEQCRVWPKNQANRDVVFISTGQNFIKLFVLGPHSVLVSGYFWLDTQELTLEMLRVIWGAEDRTKACCMPGKHPTCYTISPVPHCFVLLLKDNNLQDTDTNRQMP